MGERAEEGRRARTRPRTKGSMVGWRRRRRRRAAQMLAGSCAGQQSHFTRLGDASSFWRPGGTAGLAGGLAAAAGAAGAGLPTMYCPCTAGVRRRPAHYLPGTEPMSAGSAGPGAAWPGWPVRPRRPQHTPPLLRRRQNCRNSISTFAASSPPPPPPIAGRPGRASRPCFCATQALFSTAASPRRVASHRTRLAPADRGPGLDAGAMGVAKKTRKFGQVGGPLPLPCPSPSLAHGGDGAVGLPSASPLGQARRWLPDNHGEPV